MARPRTDASALSTFAITSAQGGYLMRIEDEGGEVLEITATFEQLELLADSIDEILDADDTEAEVDEEEDEEETGDEDEDE